MLRMSVLRASVGSVALAMIGALTLVGAAQAEQCPPLSQTKRNQLIKEHVYGGAPSTGAIFVRRGYVTVYDAEHRVPYWTAWHVTPDYLKPPHRTGRWSSFRTDTLGSARCRGRACN